jgi:hypothetical protein
LTGVVGVGCVGCVALSSVFTAATTSARRASGTTESESTSSLSHDSSSRWSPSRNAPGADSPGSRSGWLITRLSNRSTVRLGRVKPLRYWLTVLGSMPSCRAISAAFQPDRLNSRTNSALCGSVVMHL